MVANTVTVDLRTNKPFNFNVLIHLEEQQLREVILDLQNDLAMHAAYSKS